ncbi:DsbA family protein [Vibrio metschnikovii]|uniref:DsbA family protein n=1 Tax=Vibrio metschnikovii TaxID=28172 RepID=UPI002FC658CE
MKIYRILLIGLLATFSLSSAAALTVEQTKQLADIEQILQRNPQVIDNLHSTLRMYEQQANRFEQVLKDNQAYLYNNPDHPSFGAQDPELTLVFFTDYSCPWCKKLDPVLHELVKRYPTIKVVSVLVPLKELDSPVNSASYALNLWQMDQQKFTQADKLLVKKPGAHNPQSLLQVAQKTDTSQALNAQEKTQQQLAKNYQLFSELGLNGTPALLIGQQIIPGYLPLDKLEPLIREKLAK